MRVLVGAGSMRDDQTNGNLSGIERAQAELRDSIAESEELSARADMLMSNSRLTMGGGGREQAQT